MDQLIIAGAPAWLEPAKFTISIAFYVFALAWAFTLIPEWLRTRRVVGWATAIAMVLELTLINLSAYSGTIRHFNFGTPLDGPLFTIGSAPDGGPGLHGTGWSTEHGDLRVRISWVSMLYKCFP